MSRKQMAFIIAVNAVISTVISVVVALLVIRPTEVVSIPTPTGAIAATEVAVAAPPAPETVTHVVQPGDTISALALQYDVSGEDIITANQLENPNFLQVGVELIIPVGGMPEVTATFTPMPTPTDTPIPFSPPSADMTATAAAELGATATPLPTSMPSTGELKLEITEVLGVGQVEQERVIITNTGTRLADMQGWTLSDSGGNDYTFPNFRLWAGGSLTVHSRIGQDGNPPGNFYWGKLAAVWSGGEVAVLKDREGNTMASYPVTQ